MPRKRFYWKLRDSELHLGERTLLMGVLNLTPDSFSDGGRFNDPDRAYARALELEEQGADIIDIGAESTKPGSERISADEEWQRLVPVLKRLRDKLAIPISLDTYKSEIAERAFEYGIQIINDPSGLTFDAEIARVVANGNAALILNHMRGQPETWARLGPLPNAPLTVARELEATANRARHAGVDRARIVIDPGLGFGKRKEQNAALVAHLGDLTVLEYPILVGPSRKSFLAKGSEQETLYATAAAVAAAVLKGAHIVRVHDVKEMLAVVQVAEEIAAAEVSHPVETEERPPQRKPRTGPSFEAERPRPPRPPLARRSEESKPVEEKPAEEVKPAAEAVRPAPRADRDRPIRPPFKDRDQRDGSRPPKRSFDKPGFRKPPFRRDEEGRRDDRRSDDRRPDDRRREDRRDGPPKRGGFRPPEKGFKRSGPGGFKPPDKGFKSSGPKRPFDRKPGGPKRSFDSSQERPERPDFKPRGRKPPFRKRP
jgi:dihydropteroate synthase